MANGIIEKLYELIIDRKKHPKKGSYTCELFNKGKEEILKKLGEECIEVIVASTLNKKERIIYELADLTYHLLVMMAMEEITPEEIFSELEKRFNK